MTIDKNSPHYIPIVVLCVIASVFFGGVGGGVAYPTLPTLGAVIGITPIFVGIILSINRFTRILLSTPAGQIIDIFGTRKPMIIGLVLQALAPFGYILGLHSYLIYALTGTQIFIVSRVIWGIGSAFVFIGAFSTVVQAAEDHNRGKWIGYFRGGQSLGFPSGLISGGLITDFFGYEIAFAFAGAAGLLAFFIAFIILPNFSNKSTNSASLLELPKLVSNDLRILMVGGLHLIVQLLYSGIVMATIVIFASNHGIGFGNLSAMGASGIFLSVSAVSISMATLASGRSSDLVHHRVKVAVPGLVIFSLGFVILATQNTAISTLIAVFSIGLGVGTVNPPILAYLSDISPEADLGKIGGVYKLFGDMGAAIGSLFAVPVYYLIGHFNLYLISAAIAIISGVLVAYLLNKNRI